jgi:hypothetical protein
MINKISWIGTLTSIIGSFLVAFHLFQLGYILFLIGSLSWLIVAIVKKDKPLLILNATFFLANVIGVFNSL